MEVDEVAPNAGGVGRARCATIEGGVGGNLVGEELNGATLASVGEEREKEIFYTQND